MPSTSRIGTGEYGPKNGTALHTASAGTYQAIAIGRAGLNVTRERRRGIRQNNAITPRPIAPSLITLGVNSPGRKGIAIAPAAPVTQPNGRKVRVGRSSAV